MRSIWRAWLMARRVEVTIPETRKFWNWPGSRFGLHFLSLFNQRRLGADTGRIWFRMNQHTAASYPDIERRHLFDKWRRRRACVRRILIPVPGTSDTAENDFALTERAVLMLTDVRDGGDFSIVFENCHALARETDNAGAVFRNVGDRAGVHKAVIVFGVLWRVIRALIIQRPHPPHPGPLPWGEGDVFAG